VKIWQDGIRHAVIGREDQLASSLLACSNRCEQEIRRSGGIHEDVDSAGRPAESAATLRAKASLLIF
jgi:hypothetical protein